MGAATDEHNALDFLRGDTCIGQLLVDVGDDFARARVDVVGCFGGRNVLNDHVAHVAGVKRIIDVLLDILGSDFTLVQSVHDVAGDVTATHGQGVEVNKRLVLIDGHSRGLGTHVNEHAAQFAIALAQDLFAHGQRGDNVVLDGNAEGHQAVQVEFQGWLSYDVVHLDLDGRAKLSHGIGCQHLVHIVGLRDNIDSVVVAERSGGCIMDDAVDQFPGDGLVGTYTAVHLIHDAVQ